MTVRLDPNTEPGQLFASLPDTLPSDVAGALDLAERLGGTAPAPGTGSTRDLWETLATIAAHDLGVVRAIEPHLDAMAIRAQAGLPIAPGRWGVFAAEGPGATLAAMQQDGAWLLSGDKPWCSLADRLDAALVTAPDADGTRRLFAVDLGEGATVQPGAWHARGLTEIPSGPVRFDHAAAEEVGKPGWYLSRPGFAWGGVGVAACWYGGAVALGRTLHAAVRGSDDVVRLMQLGAVDEALQSARLALTNAAALADADAVAIDERLVAKRARAAVARVCEEVLGLVARALGPAPLALDERHAKRVADLGLYIRQHHAEKDLASLGAAVASDVAPW